MKLLLLVFVSLLYISCADNLKKPEKTASQDTAKTETQASYDLAIPPGWTTEKIPFPIEFAPQISYKGTEDLRFAPGWAKKGDPQYWSYAFLWWLENDPAINEEALEKDLTAYYNGLVNANIAERKIPSIKIVPTVIKVKKISTAPNDTATYSGTINMLDYMIPAPMVLNSIIHVRNCESKKRTAVYFAMSPQQADHAIWKEFDGMVKGLGCN